MTQQIFSYIFVLLMLMTACQPQPTPTTIPTTETAVSAPATIPSEITNYTYKIINRFPHDSAAFTQGLIYQDGILYEGTGRYGQSSLRQVDLETGNVLVNTTIPEQYFGEGITLFAGKIYQLTWKGQTGFIYDAHSFELLDTFTYPTEGWGLTHDGAQLIMSDGTNNIYFLDPTTLEVNGRLSVYDDQGNPVTRLNELEYINGEIYANVWQTNQIARINPHTGHTTAWIDLTGLLSQENLSQPVDVLNGIAYDAENGRLFVTGKLWPTLFEIALVETAVVTPSPYP